MSQRGSLAVMSILSLSVGLAAATVWYHWDSSCRIQASWGRDPLHVIATAPLVEAARLAPVPSDISVQPPPLSLGGLPWYPAAWADISGGRGLVHLRTALGLDASFDWSAVQTGPIAWSYAVRFVSDRQPVVLAISDQGSWITLAPDGGQVCSSPIAPGLRDLLNEYLSPPASAAR